MRSATAEDLAGREVQVRGHHLTSREILAEIDERIGQRELQAITVASIAAQYMSPGEPALVAFATGCWVNLGDLYDALAAERRVVAAEYPADAETDALDMALTWCLNGTGEHVCGLRTRPAAGGVSE